MKSIIIILLLICDFCVAGSPLPIDKHLKIPTESSFNTQCDPEYTPKTAEEVGKCLKPHWQVESTASPRVALTSFSKALKELDKFCSEEESPECEHSFELSDLLQMYAYLATKDQLKEIQKLSKEKIFLRASKVILNYRNKAETAH